MAKRVNEPVTLEWFQSAPAEAQTAALARFNGKLRPADEHGCQHWTGTLDRRGHPTFYIGGAMISARKMAQIAAGRDPLDYAGSCCGHRTCAAIDHLVPHTAMPNRGRPAGSRNKGVSTAMPSRKVAQ